MNLYRYRPKTYRKCIEYVGKRENILCLEDIKNVIGLRNLLVHRYYEIDDIQIYNFIKENFNCLERFIDYIVDKYG